MTRRRPRTPVHFPRMKVRGWRNKAKSAGRRRHRTVFPHVAVTIADDGHSARADVIAEWQPGCQRLEIDSVIDGWGRPVPNERPHMVLRPAEPPTPEPTFSMQFKVENTMSNELWDMLFGRDRDGT
jgi:hypothetical protein